MRRLEDQQGMEEETLSRRSNRHQKKGSGKWGGRIFTIISIFVVLAVAGGAYFFYDMKKQEVLAYERYEEAAKELLTKVQAERDQSGIANEKTEKNSKDLKTVIYAPKSDTQGMSPEDAKKQLQALVTKAQKKLPKNDKAVIIAKMDVKNLSDQLDQYQLTADAYHWQDSKGTFTQESVKEDQPVYIYHKTGKPVTVHDLVPDDASLLGIQQVIQQKILDEAENKEAIIDQVINFPRISFENQIDYTPENLKIHLPENDLKIAEMTLEYKDIFPYINASLVDAEKLKDAKPSLEAGKKYVALTFDDGPNPSTTPQVLDTLKSKGAHATFFLLGQNVDANKELVKRIYDEGNEVASHSYDHPLLTSLNDDQIKAEIQKTDKAIFQACGVLPRNIRAPYGAADARVGTITGKPFIHWSVDSEDWKSKNAAAIISQIKNTLYEGSIVLMHDIQPATVEALPTVIDNMRAEGYEFVSVDTMLQKSQKPMFEYFANNDNRALQ